MKAYRVEHSRTA